MATNKKITELPAATLPILGSGSRIELVQGGINVQTDPDNIGGGGTSIPFGSTTGTNSYSATMSPVVAAYADGAMYHIRVGNSSTSTVTFDLGPGAKKAFVTDGSQAQGGHFLAGVDYLITYKSSLDSGAGGFLVVNELIHGLMNIRGTYTSGSSGLYPASGGSGPAAAIRHGDAFVMADSDTLGTRLVQIGDLVFTGVDAPGQTEANWYIQPGYNSLALKAPLASPAFTGNPTAPTPSAADNDTSIATTAFVQTELASYVNEETFTTLTFAASPTNWDQNNRQSPLAKVTATGNFTINMTNVKSGAEGILKIIANTASAFTLTFDTDFTNKDLITGTTLTTYTFPANNGFEYTNSFYVDGTTIYWVIGDYLSGTVINPWAHVSRAAAQSIANNDVTVALSFDTETTDNAAIFDAGSPTRLTIPGSGNKIVTVSVLIDFATNTTGVRRIWLYKNGAASPGGIAQAAPVASVSTTMSATFQAECAAGDYYEIIPYQNSGGSLNVTGRAYIKVENR